MFHLLTCPLAMYTFAKDVCFGHRMLNNADWFHFYDTHKRQSNKGQTNGPQWALQAKGLRHGRYPAILPLVWARREPPEELIWSWRRKAGWAGLGKVMYKGEVPGRPRKERKSMVHASEQASPFSYSVCPQAPHRTPTAATFQKREGGCNSIKQGMEKMSP